MVCVGLLSPVNVCCGLEFNFMRMGGVEKFWPTALCRLLLVKLVKAIVSGD